MGIKPWDVFQDEKKSGQRKVVQDRERANRGTETWVSKACEDDRRETNLLQTVFFIQSQISLRPGIIKLVCKAGISTSSLTLKLKDKTDFLFWKGEIKDQKYFSWYENMPPILENTTYTLLRVGTLWCLTRLGSGQGPRESTQASCPGWRLLGTWATTPAWQNWDHVVVEWATKHRLESLGR